MPPKKKIDRQVCVFVEYYRATAEEGKALRQFLEEYEAVASIGKDRRRASGAVELGQLFTVYVLPVIVSYAGNKVLTIIEEHVKQWFEENRRNGQFITLQLSTQAKKRRIGQGRPKRR